MFINRGLLIHPEEYSESWLIELQQAGLNTLGLHPVGGINAHDSLEEALRMHAIPSFQSQIDLANQKGIQIEYEAHALRWLLPRSLFGHEPDWFRMNERGVRIPDFHMCVSNRDAHDYVASRAQTLARQLWTGSHRWFLWPDDVHGKACHCAECKRLSPSDQALMITNAIAKGIRQFDPLGRVAFLAYQDTLEVPQHVEPEDGIFLEFAPIWRDHHRPLRDADCEKNAKETRQIRSLLTFFGTSGSQALDYWMDNSLFSQWQKPPRPFILHADVLLQDALYYAELGFESVTSFGCYFGPDYRTLYGLPPILEYGRQLSK